MAQYLAPTENLPIFNSFVFPDKSTTGLTLEEANALYVHYPFAQGTENFTDVIVGNTLTVDNLTTINSTLTSNDIVSENSLTVVGNSTFGLGAVSTPSNITNTNLYTTFTYIAPDISPLAQQYQYPTLTSTTGMQMAITGNESGTDGEVDLYNTDTTHITSTLHAFNFRKMQTSNTFKELISIRNSGTLEAHSNIILDTLVGGNQPYIQYKDNTQQISAYTGAGSLAGSYTSSNITIDANGKITAIANGSGGGGGASLTANQTFSGVNGFSNTIQGTNATSPISYTSTIAPSSITSSSHITSKGFTDATYAQLGTVNTFSGSGTNTFNTPINITGTNSLVVGGYCGLTTGVIIGTNTGGQYLTVQAPVFAGTSGTGYIDPLLYGNDITTSSSIVDNSITSRKYNDSRYLMLSNSSGQTVSTPITTTTFINAQNGITSLLTTQIGNNGVNDKLYIRAPIYTDSAFATKPMSYALDVSTYGTLTGNMIMNKTYIDNIVGSSANLSITSLTTSSGITCGTNLQVNGNTILGDGVGTDTVSINGNIFGSTNSTPLSYPSTVTSFTSSTQNIPSIAYTNSNYASLANNNTLSGIQTISGVVQGNTGGTAPLSYPSTISSTMTNYQLPNKLYIDNNYITLATSQTGITGDKTMTGTITVQNQLVVGDHSNPTLTYLQLNGYITGYSLYSPISYYSTIGNTTTTFSSDAMLVSRGFCNNNYASLTANQTLSGVNGFSNTIQGTNGTSPISYSAGITASTITSPQHIASKAYVDNAISVSGGASLSANQTFTGTNTFSNTLTGSSAIVAGISSAPTAISLYCLGQTQFSSTVFGYNGSSVTPMVYASTVTNSNITANQHIVMKGYTDATYASLSGATFTGTLNSNNGLTVNSNIIVSSTGSIWGKSYREKTAPATINTAGTVYTIDWSTSGVNTLNTAPTANFTLNIWNITLSTTQTNVMTLKYLNTGKFYPSTINVYSDSGSTAITTTKYWVGGTPTIASAYISTISIQMWQAGVLDGTSNNICELTLGNAY